MITNNQWENTMAKKATKAEKTEKVQKTKKDETVSKPPKSSSLRMCNSGL